MTLQTQAVNTLLAHLGHYQAGDTLADLLPGDHAQWVTTDNGCQVLLYGEDTWGGSAPVTMWSVAAEIQHGELTLADWIDA